MTYQNLLLQLSSDSVLFFVLQATLITFVMFAVARNWLAARRAGRGGATLTVTRGTDSMMRFYGTYVAVSGVLIAVCLSTEVAENHRVFWSLLDSLLVAYVCLYNPWFRNLLLGWVAHLTTIEQR